MTRQFALGLVLVATLALATLNYWRFLQNPRPLWNGIVHDRHGHYEFAQKMALAIREGDPLTFLSTLEKAKIWPPVHGLLAAMVLAVGGLDYRLAVLPSLVGWVMTATAAFLLARRISAGCGNTAGVIAAVMILASPGYRIYGTDIMLESLGAGLTMLALYFYTIAKQEPSVAAWRRLAIALTVLFFEKYNYWLLVVLALGAAEISSRRADFWLHARHFAERVNWPAWLRAQTREPLNYVFGAAALVTAMIYFSKPAPLQVGTHEVSLYPPNNLVTLTYAVLFFRVLAGWKRTRTSLDALAGPAGKQLWLWHALPVAISFLLPQRLSYFAWFLGPLNHSGPPRPPSQAAAYYAHRIWLDYHVAIWSAAGAAILFALALLTLARLRPGGRAVVLLVLISAVATIAHPNQKSRFLHSWLAVGWVAGAAGLASLIHSAGRRQRPLAFAIGTTLVVAHAPFLVKAAPPGKEGYRGDATSLLDITDAYLPELGNARRVAVFSTLPCNQFILWTHRERYRRQDAIELPLREYPLSAMGVQQRFKRWTATTSADVAILLDIAPGSPDFPGWADYPAYSQIRDLMAGESRFRLFKEWRLPQHGCAIVMWVRN